MKRRSFLTKGAAGVGGVAAAGVAAPAIAQGRKEMVIPWLAAWLPNMIFLFIGGTMVSRLR